MPAPAAPAAAAENDIDDLTDAFGAMQSFSVDLDSTDAGMSPGLPVLIRAGDLQASWSAERGGAATNNRRPPPSPR
jgi:hypothetical protein